MFTYLWFMAGNEKIFPYNSGENVEEAIIWLCRAFNLYETVFVLPDEHISL